MLPASDAACAALPGNDKFNTRQMAGWPLVLRKKGWRKVRAPRNTGAG